MRPPMQGAFSGETALADFILTRVSSGALDGRRLRNYLTVIERQDQQAS